MLADKYLKVRDIGIFKKGYLTATCPNKCNYFKTPTIQPNWRRIKTYIKYLEHNTEA